MPGICFEKIYLNRYILGHIYNMPENMLGQIYDHMSGIGITRLPSFKSKS